MKQRIVMSHRYLIAAALVIVTGCGSSDIRSLGDLGLSGWPELEKKLTSDLPITPAPNQSVYDGILDAGEAKRIYAQGTPELWATMCDSGSPLVPVLGYRCIAEKSKADAFRAALAVLAHRGSASLLMFAEPLQLINEALPTEDNKKVFSAFVTDPKHLKVKLDEVTAFLTEHFVQEWAVTADLKSVPDKVQSLAVGTVYAKALEDGSSIPESVATLFDSFDKSSGDRLAVFVHYAPKSTEPDRLKVAIERLLRDDDVSIGMYYIALSAQREFIGTHIDVETLKLNPSHDSRYDRWRQSAANRQH